MLHHACHLLSPLRRRQCVAQPAPSALNVHLLLQPASPASTSTSSTCAARPSLLRESPRLPAAARQAGCPGGAQGSLLGSGPWPTPAGCAPPAGPAGKAAFSALVRAPRRAASPDRRAPRSRVAVAGPSGPSTLLFSIAKWRYALWAWRYAARQGSLRYRFAGVFPFCNSHRPYSGSRIQH
jgi:hypothetical protein